MSYADQLNDVRWKEKARLIVKRDKSTCRYCTGKTHKPQVHHRWYIDGLMAWEYDNDILVTLCPRCHYKVHRNDVWFKKISIKNIAKRMGFKFR